MAKNKKTVLPEQEKKPAESRPAKRKPSAEPLDWNLVRRDIQIAVGLVVVTFLTYVRVAEHKFLIYDDGRYVYENDFVKSGLNAKSFWWGLTTDFFANWHPVTWWSHMLDAQMFGPDAGKHHLTSVVIHCAAAVLFYLAFRHLTGRTWPSAAVAFLFALHPLHVESVAWVAERKDVLSGFFGAAALLAYAMYVKRPSWKGYAATLGLFALGLMSKPMLVTWPFVLLLLDYWPLNRLRFENGLRSAWPLVREKIPFFVLTVVSSIVTYAAQKSGGGVKEVGLAPFGFRLQNALVSYAEYLFKTVWPTKLAVLYPYPTTIPAWQVGGAVLLLLGITAFVLWKGRKYAYLPFGWFWFLGTLVPVIGLVQVGEQSMADRYTYLPLVGIFVAVVWGVADVTANRKPELVAGLAGVIFVALTVTTFIQLGHWKDDITIFSHAVAVTKDNQICNYNLACAFDNAGRYENSVPYYLETLRVKPDKYQAYNNLGSGLYKKGKYEEAVPKFAEAVRLNPSFAPAHTNLGLALYMLNRNDEAEAACRRGIEADPRYADARYALGLVLERKGQLREALQNYSAALQLNPNHGGARGSFNGLQTRLNSQTQKS